MKQSVLVQLLLYTAACVLQARSLSYKSTDVKDALSHLEAETSNHFPPNTTEVDEDGYDALTHLDQLSLVTHYAGLGYNIISSEETLKATSIEVALILVSKQLV